MQHTPAAETISYWALAALIVGLVAASPGNAAAMAKKPVSDPCRFESLHAGLEISDYLRGVIEEQGGAPMAIVVPAAMTRDAATARAFGFQLKISGSGYSAVMGDGVLDYVINGATGKGGADYTRAYEDFDDGRGGSMAFGFRGGDYQVEIYCLARSPDPAANCLEADVLEAFVDDLIGGGEPR